jgi:outer membrane immunogenic protein
VHADVRYVGLFLLQFGDIFLGSPLLGTRSWLLIDNLVGFEMQMVVKKGLLAAAAVLGMSGFAAAADMAVKAVAPAPYLYDWSGIYVGGVVGGAWGTHDLSNTGLGIVGTILGSPVVQTNKPSAFIGGVEIGSRYQFGKLVVGWEGDVTWGDINNTSTLANAGPLLPGAFNRSLSTSVNWTGTGTATIGIAHNNWLLYGKAGAAVENVSYTENVNANIPALGIAGNVFSGTGSDKNRVGWTVGTGIEWAFWQNWSVKAEYDYLDFGNRNVAINGSALGVPLQLGLQDNNHVNQFKAGLNYKFMPNFW